VKTPAPPSKLRMPKPAIGLRGYLRRVKSGQPPDPFFCEPTNLSNDGLFYYGAELHVAWVLRCELE
jgi:hypothetical protein